MTISEEARAAALFLAQRIDDRPRERTPDELINPYSFEAGLLERKLRHRVAKLGLKVIKSRSRDRRSHDWGLWGLRDITTGDYVNPALVDGIPCSWRLDQVAGYLRPPSARRRFERFTARAVRPM